MPPKSFKKNGLAVYIELKDVIDYSSSISSDILSNTQSQLFKNNIIRLQIVLQVQNTVFSNYLTNFFLTVCKIYHP